MGIIPIPSIDFLKGRPCRLLRGDPSQATFYNTDPLERALEFEARGAQRFHMVNLDGALGGEAATLNQQQIKRVIEALRIPIQVGGGIRTGQDVLAAAELGINYIILGTSALNPDIITQQYLQVGILESELVADIGFVGNRVLVKGWQDDIGLSVSQAVARIIDFGFKRLVLTNKSRDGAQTGPDLSTIRAVATQYPNLQLIISGGISTEQHLKAIQSLKLANIEGFIIGKRLWSEDGLDFFSRAVAMFA